jgi:hypothetical protein
MNKQGEDVDTTNIAAFESAKIQVQDDGFSSLMELTKEEKIELIKMWKLFCAS